MQYYKTVKKFAREEIEIKKSKFIASVDTVENEKKAREFVENIKKEFWDATHNVFAYRVGSSGEAEKQHDDGEPAGTAGKPLLEVIKNEDLKDIVIVVTRYFGGTYLGAGGLVRAYSNAAIEGIKKAIVVKKIFYFKLKVVIDYSSWGKIQNEVNNISGVVLDVKYEDVVTLIILVLPEKVDYLKNFINNLTGGNAKLNEIGSEYFVPE